MKKRNDQPWIPLWVDKWIFGSTRYELSNEERAIWVDFLALAAKDSGYIRANTGFPYPISALAGILNVDSELISRVISRLKETGKIVIEKDGVIRINQWDDYQLSARHTRRYKDDVRKSGHSVRKSGHSVRKNGRGVPKKNINTKKNTKKNINNNNDVKNVNNEG